MDSTGAADLKTEAVRPRKPASRTWAVLIVVGGIAGGAISATRPAAASCLQGGEMVAVTDVAPDLTLRLADGRTILLAGMDPWGSSDDPSSGEAGRTLGSWVLAETVLLRPLAAEPDRWGRIAAVASIPSQPVAAEGTPSLAERLIGAGLARARPDPRLSGCWAGFLTQERAARDARLGLWAEPRYAVIAATDRARLRASTGSMAIVKGTIKRVVESRARTYLAFGDRGREDFALSIQRPLLARWRAAGTDPATWVGREIQVRGYLDDRFGMQIELTAVDQIEFTASH